TPPPAAKKAKGGTPPPPRETPPPAAKKAKGGTPPPPATQTGETGSDEANQPVADAIEDAAQELEDDTGIVHKRRGIRLKQDLS
ncbi:MAG: hypothetical protein WBN51_09085, partial [Gammaproteobacteria bacterium]